MDFVSVMLAIATIPVSYFLTMALLGAIIEMADAWKICASVVVALLVFVALTAP